MEKEAQERARGGEGGRPSWAEELEQEATGREIKREPVEVGEGGREWQGKWGREEEEEDERERGGREKGVRLYRLRSNSSSRVSL